MSGPFKKKMAIPGRRAVAFSDLLKRSSHYVHIEKYDEALKTLDVMLRIKPNDATALYNRGVVLQAVQRHVEAIECYQKAIGSNPDLKAAYNNLGASLQKIGRHQEAIKYFYMALERDQEYEDAHNNIGVSLQEMRLHLDAINSFEKAIKINQNLVAAHFNRGNALRSLKLFDQAAHSYATALSLNPNHINATINLAVVLKETHQYKLAYEKICDAERLSPNNPIILNNKGNLLHELGCPDDAISCYQKIINLFPESAEAYHNQSNALLALSRYFDALRSVNEAIRMVPDYVYALNNRGNILKELGFISEAEVSYREALKIDSEFLIAHSNLLFLLNYHDKKNPDEVFIEYKRYGQYIKSKELKKFSHNNRNFNAKQKIKIGYISADFRNHACRFFMMPLFESRNKEKFELHAYSNVRHPDAYTKLFQSYADRWVDAAAMTDSEIAENIYRSGVDILVDLSGHTMGNRLGVFAQKPAPIQLTYPIGTGYTTGLDEIDGIFSDELLIPDQFENLYTESVVRVDSPLFCYQPPVAITPEPNLLPALKNGYITFGCMSRTIRLSDVLLNTWAAILVAIPSARLRLDQKIFSEAQSTKLFKSRMERLGLPMDRVDLVDTRPHWDGYHAIDISLDCFPHNAGTTTFESLWMGVPVLTKIGQLSVGRFGASILIPLGLSDWVTNTPDEYVTRATELANNLPMLINLRRTLRSRLIESEFMNAKLFTKKIETKFEDMMNNYLHSKNL
jgi:protein O-GlcNAc transferase